MGGEGGEPRRGGGMRGQALSGYRVKVPEDTSPLFHAANGYMK